MITFIYRGQDNTIIDGVFIKGQSILNFIQDSDWERIYNKYKGFFDKRIQTEKNPNGCFIVNINKEKASEQGKEAGQIELNIGEKIEKIVDDIIKEEAPHLVEAHKENRKKKLRKNRIINDIS